VADIAWIIQPMFISGWIEPPEWWDQFCLAEADVNQSGGLNPTSDDISIGDLSILIDYLFVSGAYDPVGNPNGRVLPDCLEQSSDPHGYPVSTDGCKMFTDGDEGFAPPSVTCMAYTYDGVGSLSLTHINASLNCCPIPNLTVAIEGDTIMITESDEGLCDCICLFDIEYQVENLPPGQYRIVVFEAYPTGGDPLDFWVDLSYARSDQFCVEREGYPWGNELAAIVTSRTGCLSFEGAAQSATAPLDQSCIAYSYDSDAQVLSISHLNAGFNCCPSFFTVTANQYGNVITLAESEVLDQGGCHCLCLYDIDFQLINLAPGVYNLDFSELYADGGPPLNFFVDLIASPTGEVCVSRDYYPWGYYDAAN